MKFNKIKQDINRRRMVQPRLCFSASSIQPAGKEMKERGVRGRMQWSTRGCFSSFYLDWDWDPVSAVGTAPVKTHIHTPVGQVERAKDAWTAQRPSRGSGPAVWNGGLGEGITHWLQRVRTDADMYALQKHWRGALLLQKVHICSCNKNTHRCAAVAYRRGSDRQTKNRARARGTDWTASSHPSRETRKDAV